MGRHSMPASRWRRVVLVVVVALVVAAGSWAGVNALVQAREDTNAAPAEPSPSASASTAPLPPGTVRGDAQAFPGQPSKKTGLTESGLASGLGDEAGDLADRAQDLVDDANRPDEEPQQPLRFVVGSFNVLGASHTDRGGNKRGWATGEARLPAQIRMLDSNDVDVVGFQEFEHTQFRSFMRRTGGSWGVYPALSKGRNFVRNSIAWRRSTWDLADYRTVTIPYFGGERVEMPVILLTHKATGRQAYFFNIHNPASTKQRGNNQKWRTIALTREIATVRRLRKAAPDVPVLLTGDFNERGEAYCRMTSGGDINAANPGGDRPGCGLPAYAGIDWIFGTADIEFSGYVVQRSGGASDHPLLAATATVP